MHTPHPSAIAGRPLGRSHGFTLIELMIAVAIVAILVSIAYPSFMDSVRKGRRAEAFASITSVQQAQERFRANKTSYAGSVTNAATGDPPGLALSGTSGSGLYELSLSDATPLNYVITATAASGKSQANDTGCQRLVMKVESGVIAYGSAGASGAIDYTDAKRCWSK
jgi:type IV pilus assembly protein PilE